MFGPFLLGVLNEKMYVLHGQQESANNDEQPEHGGPNTDTDFNIKDFGKHYKTILLSHGPITSLTILNSRGVFRKAVPGYVGKDLEKKVR